MPAFPSSIRALVAALTESEGVDFKAAFDPASTADWCELLKDILAIANTGGGGILFSVDDDGKPSGYDVTTILATDTAVFSDKIYSYTGIHFGGLDVQRAIRAAHPIACLRIAEASVPLIPTRPGTYPTTSSKQASAFPRGIVLVRHGPKSEPATTEDLRRIIQKQVQQDRRAWIGRLRRIVEAPLGSTVSFVSSPPKQIRELGRPPEILPSGSRVVASGLSDAIPIRVVSDLAAPAYQLLDPDRSHPHRMNELLSMINSQLKPHGILVSAYDIKVVGLVHDIYSNLEYCYKSQYGPRKFSSALSEWLVERLKRDKMFLKVARAKLHRIQRSQR
jgi:hypothetical protein